MWVNYEIARLTIGLIVLVVLWTINPVLCSKLT
jgi:hypothetical protein